MNIGLMDPGTKKFATPMPHAGLAYVAASLERRGHSATLLDMEMATKEEMEAFFRTPFDAVGITATSFTYRRAVEALGAYKKIHPGTPAILGGPHASVELGKVLERPEIDFAVYGEGEETMAELAASLDEAGALRRGRAEGILGLIHRQDGRVAVNPPRPWNRALDDLGFPAYRSLPMDRYKAYPLITSRGCPHQCSFCAASILCGSQWRGRTPENLFEEVQYLVSNWGNKPIAVCDDNFNVQPERVKRFCSLLTDSGIRIEWHCWSFRADRADPDMLDAMRRSGCRSVSVGVESADPRVLRNIRKNETLAEIEEGIRNIKNAGILCQTLNMIGNPGDNLETVKETIAFNRRLKVDGATFYLAIPYPKTGLWDYVEKNGRFLESDYTRSHHFSTEPIFETQDFTREQRSQAYRMARRFELRTALATSFRRKLMRVFRGDLQGIGWVNIQRSIVSLARLAFNLVFCRQEEV